MFIDEDKLQKSELTNFKLQLLLHIKNVIMQLGT
jgi:hypothetical protein